MRGAHELAGEINGELAGPSPRAWGSRTRRARADSRERSIPTCVGLTASHPACPVGEPVHPHVRGAHTHVPCLRAAANGPSPRAWGSPLRISALLLSARSIPTCVGLTFSISRAGASPPVHPHVRGAHSARCCESVPPHGPSPRAWGSPGRRETGRAGLRSIPTCVGLTAASPDQDAAPSVHPHVRGAHCRSR